jgi:hypothetical protein
LLSKSYIEKQQIFTEIRSQMVQILRHYIGCRWGAHYTTMYNQLIQPYLDNTYVLHFVLKGETIYDSPNIITGISGAKIFPELAQMMWNVESPKIKIYLQREFISKIQFSDIKTHYGSPPTNLRFSNQS